MVTLTPAKVRHLTVMRMLADNDHELSAGVPGRTVASALWPDSPAWNKRTRKHGTNDPGAIGGTMPMKGARAARELNELGLVHINYTEHHQALFRISEAGRRLLEQIEAGGEPVVPERPTKQWRPATSPKPARKPQPPKQDCPNCGEPDMLFFPGDEPGEPDVFQCPDCLHEIVLDDKNDEESTPSKEQAHPYSGNRSQDTCWVGWPDLCGKPIEDPIHVGSPSYPGTGA